MLESENFDPTNLEKKHKSVDNRQQESEKINTLALAVQEAPDKEAKQKAIEDLWLEVEPRLRPLVLDRSYQEAGDIMQSFYTTKFLLATNSWKSEGGNFKDYCAVALSRFTIDYIRRLQRTKEVEEKARENEYDEENLEIEDKITLGQIKSKLLGWIEGGVITPIEGLSLIIQFGLGRELAESLVSKFKDSDERVTNFIFDEVDFNKGVVGKKEIALLGYKSTGAASKAVTRAVDKIKIELNLA